MLISYYGIKYTATYKPSHSQMNRRCNAERSVHHWVNDQCKGL